jgi:hypothetical protein
MQTLKLAHKFTSLGLSYHQKQSRILGLFCYTLQLGCCIARDNWLW